MAGMPRGRVSVFAVAALLYSSIGSQSVSAQMPTSYPETCVNVSSNVLIQPNWIGTTWKGWGTTLGWWANWAGAISSEPQSKLLDLVFNKTAGGLGLNVVRYNIGGGSTVKSIMDRYTYKPYMVTPGYLDSPGGAYNWSRDKYQRSILYGAIARGVDVIEVVAFSPPDWMTISKDNEGSASFGVPNLDPSRYTEYASYLATVTAAF